MDMITALKVILCSASLLRGCRPFQYVGRVWHMLSLMGLDAGICDCFRYFWRGVAGGLDENEVYVRVVIIDRCLCRNELANSHGHIQTQTNRHMRREKKELERKKMASEKVRG